MDNTFETAQNEKWLHKMGHEIDYDLPCFAICFATCQAAAADDDDTDEDDDDDEGGMEANINDSSNMLVDEPDGPDFAIVRNQ